MTAKGVLHLEALELSAVLALALLELLLEEGLVALLGLEGDLVEGLGLREGTSESGQGSPWTRTSA